MIRATKKMLCIGLMALMMSAGLLPLLPTASAADPGDTGGHVDYAGDWIVVGQLTYHPGSEIHLTGGNLRIKTGASLTLDQAGVLFSSGNHGQYGITVENGGTLIIKNKGWLDYAPGITHTWRCNFLAGSTINFPKANILHMGGMDPTNMFNTGCYIGTANATFEYTFAGGNDVGGWELFRVDAPGVVFRNSTFSFFTNTAVVITQGASATIDNCTFKASAPSPQSKSGVYVFKGSAFIMNSKFSGLTTAIGTDFGDIHVERTYINNNSWYGIQIFGQMSKLTSVDNQIDDNYNGIVANMEADLTLKGINKITHNQNYGIVLSQMCNMNSTGTELRFNGAEAITMFMMSTAEFRNGYITGGSITYLVTVDQLSSLLMEKTTIRPQGTSAVLNVVNGATLTFIGNTIDATGMTSSAAITAGQNTVVNIAKNKIIETIFGLMLVNGATVHSTGNNYLVAAAVFETSTGSSVFSEGDTMKTTMSMTTTFPADTRSLIYIQHGTIEMTGNPVALTWITSGSSFYISDSTIKAPGLDVAGIWASDDGYNSFINVTGGNLDPAHMKVMNGGMIQLGWHVDIQVQWQNGVPVPEANVRLRDMTSYFDLNFMTDRDGMLSTDVMQFSVGEMLTLKHNPYNFSAELNGMIGNTSVTVDKNMLGAKAVVIQIDDTASPDLNITFPTDDWATSQSIFTMNGTADDIGSSLDSVWVNLDASMGWAMADGLYDWEYELNLTEGKHAIHVEAKDVAGMVTEKDINVTVDLTKPDVRIAEPAGLYVTTHKFYLNGTTEVNASVSINGSAFSKTSDGKFSEQFNLTDGKYNITVEATDLVGNLGSATKEVIVDTVPPKVTCNKANGDWVSTNNFTLTGTTDGNFVTVNAVNATMDLKNGTWSIKENLADGPHQMVMVAKDLAGNKNSLQVNLNIDTVPPVLTVKTPAGTGTYYTNNATLTVSGTVINATLLTLNGVNVTIGTNGNFSTSFTLADGTNTVTVLAKDLAGNQAKWERTVVLDKKAPKVTITSPATGLVTNKGTIDVIGTVDDLTAAIKQGTKNVTTTNGSFTVTVTLSAGANTVTITATDLAGNVGTANVVITQDLTAQLTVTSPKKTKVTVTSNTVTISGTSEKGAIVTINDLAVPVDANGAFSIKYTLKEGKNTINVKAVDPAGNPATQAFTVTYNNDKQYTMMALLALGILLMMIGLVLGLVVGRAMAKPKAPPPEEEEEEETKPAPKEEEEEEETKPAPEEEEEEKPFTPEEEEEEVPEPKGSLKDKQGVTEAPTGTTETKPTPTKADTKPEVKPAPPKSKDPDSLEDLLKDLDKKKK